MSFRFLHYEKISLAEIIAWLFVYQAVCQAYPTSCKQSSVLILGKAHWQPLSPSNS